jgi:hypothetical protein
LGKKYIEINSLDYWRKNFIQREIATWGIEHFIYIYIYVLIGFVPHPHFLKKKPFHLDEMVVWSIIYNKNTGNVILHLIISHSSKLKWLRKSINAPNNLRNPFIKGRNNGTMSSLFKNKKQKNY